MNVSTYTPATTHPSTNGTNNMLFIGHLTWYEEEIRELTQCPIVNLSIYVTSKTDPIVTSQPVEEATAVENDVRRSLYLDLDGDDSPPSTPDEDAIETSSDPTAEALEKELGFGRDHIEALQKELGIGTLGTQEELVRDKRISKRLSQRYSANLEAQMDQRPMSYIETMSGRPDLTALIKGIVKNAEQRDTVAVGGNTAPLLSSLCLIPNFSVTEY